MKKPFLLQILFAFAVIILFYSNIFAQVSVTFQVNMGYEIRHGLWTRSDTVVVRGDFENTVFSNADNWSGYEFMMGPKTQGDSVYVLTAIFPSSAIGNSYQFKYVTLTKAQGQDNWETVSSSNSFDGTGNRGFILSAAGNNLPVVNFSDLFDTINSLVKNIVQFQVDMSNYIGTNLGDFDPAKDSLVILGLSNWGGYTIDQSTLTGNRTLQQSIINPNIFSTTLSFYGPIGDSTAWKIKAYPDSSFGNGGGYELGDNRWYHFVYDSVNTQIVGPVIPTLIILGGYLSLDQYITFNVNMGNAIDFHNKMKIDPAKINFVGIKGGIKSLGNWLGMWTPIDTIDAPTYVDTISTMKVLHKTSANVWSLTKKIPAGTPTGLFEFKFACDYQGVDTVNAGTVYLDNEMGFGVNHSYTLKNTSTPVTLNYIFGQVDTVAYFANLPQVVSTWVTNVIPTGAALYGFVNANNSNTTVKFDYGTTINYGSSIIADHSPISANDSAQVNANLTGLTPNTLYHFRIEATNDQGTIYSTDNSFTTLKSQEWKIQIKASTNLLIDSTSFAGVNNSATDGFDTTFDVPKPPVPPNNYVYVFFPHPEWNSIVGPNFQSDIRQNSDLTYNNKVWSFAVATDQHNQTMSVKLLLDAAIPWSYPIKLIDMKTDSTVDFRNTNSYTYNTGTDTVRMFQLIVGGPYSISHNYSPGWNIMGVPLNSANVKDSIFNQSVSTYLYDYSPHGGYFLSKNLDMAKGYWLGSLAPVAVNVAGVQNNDTIGVSLTAGFNLISLPYYVPNYSKSMLFINNGSITVSLDSAVTLGWISPALYAYQSTLGSYSSVDTLSPWSGYWFAAVDSSLRLIFGPPTNSGNQPTSNSQNIASLKKDKNISGSDWFVKLKLQDGKSVDQLGEFGVEANAKAGFDARYDLPHPPASPSSDYIYLAFPHPEWNSVIGPNFSTDIRPIAQSATWEFVVGTPGKQTNAVLTWDSASVPQGITLMLSDFGNSSTNINMSKVGTYQFTINDNDSLIIYSMTTGIPQQSSLIPAHYALLQNYPNPFNPSTMISYDLPKRSYVKLTIYDMLGREVTTLVSEEKAAGSYKVKFDATSLSSGVYLYRIQAGNFVNTKKLILLK